MKEESKWKILATISIGAFMASLDGSIVNITLPTLVKIFNTGFADTKWVVLIYLFIVTILILPFGKLGDIIGKKKIYITGYTIFTIGSLLCALSSSLHLLVASRLIQGIGAAMLMSLGFALITETFSSKERGKAIGIVATVVSVGIITGPVLGGIILDHFSWRFIFYINIPVGIFGISMVSRYIKFDENKEGSMFDFKSVMMLFAFMLTLLFGISSTGNTGFNTLSLGLFSASIISFILFIYIELKAQNPLIDFNLFRNKTFSIGLISGITVFISLAGVLILLPFYLEEIMGFKSGESGLLISVIPIFMGISSPIAGIFADKFGSEKITIAGILILLIGFTLASSLTLNTTVFDSVVRFIFIGAGMGFFMTPNNNAIMGSVPVNRLGVSSGMLALSRTLGQTLGVAVLGSYWLRKINTFVALGTDDLSAKMMAFQSTFTFVIIMMTIILFLNIYILKFRTFNLWVK